MISKQNAENRRIVLILLVLSGLAGWIFIREKSSNKNQIEAPIVDTKVTQEPSVQTEGSFSSENTAKPGGLVMGATGLSEVEKKKWQIISENIDTKNDNDPRVDNELKSLSPAMHAKIREAYRNTPMENRNGRGFLAFLIARDLQSVEDVQFLKSIYDEPPCLGMNDCSKELEADEHIDSINQTSLNYPQYVTLYQIQKKLESRPEILKDPSIKSEIEGLLREAKQFPAPEISSKVDAIQEGLGL